MPSYPDIQDLSDPPPPGARPETTRHEHYHYWPPADGVPGPFNFPGWYGDGAVSNGGGGLFGRSAGPGWGGRPGGNGFGGRDRDAFLGDDACSNGGGGLYGLGYVADAPDHRDWSFTISRKTAPYQKSAAAASGAASRGGGAQKTRQAVKLPDSVDLRKGDAGDPFGPVLDQGGVNNCTAHVVAAMSEYHLRQLLPKGRTQFSRYFLYNVSRELLGIPWDSGCTLRHTLKAVNKYGCLPLRGWPDDPRALWIRPAISDLERAQFARQLAYCRIDEQEMTGPDTLRSLLQALADGYPVAFGFSPSRPFRGLKGENSSLELPRLKDPILGGHAVLAVGYELRGKSTGGQLSGYLLIRNSWGEEWGDGGYAWLSFDYVTEQLAYDFWLQYPVPKPDEAGNAKYAGQTR